jgi:iron complex transport system ATP-binding protein
MLRLDSASLALGERRVVDAVSLQVRPGRLLVLVGPNGAGKSSVLGLLSGRLRPDSGQALLDDRPLQDWAPRVLATRRAVLSQRVHLGFGFRVSQVVMLGRSPHPGARESVADRRIIAAVLDAVGARHLATRSYLALSGGEQQRVQMARVLAQVWDRRDPPATLLLDEPEAGLDIAHQHQLLRLAQRLAGEGFGVCAVLHDLNLAARYADDIAVLAQGRLRCVAAPQQALEPERLSEIYGLPLRHGRVRDSEDWLVLPA